MNFRSVAREVRRTFDSHEPLVKVSISRANLIDNLNAYKKRYPDLAFAPVLKSNAYGHGLVVIAQLLDTEKVSFFMVDSFYEARTLRRNDVRTKIVVMGYVRPEEIATSRLRGTEYALVDIEQLRQLTKIARKPVRVHMKIDTGMHRHGILPEQLPEASTLLHSNKNLRLVGVGSHFADADNPDPEHTLQQISLWNTVVKKLEYEFPTIEYRHIAATKGVPLSAEANANVARLGIGLYGFDTSPEGTTFLKPVLEMSSGLSSIREIPPGDSVGYNATFTATRPMRIATVPVGYFEGVDRRLSNKGSMLVHGKKCPIVGRVSMNMSSLDVTNVPEATQGDRVVVISRDPQDPNSIENIVKAIQTPEYKETEYVILIHIPMHLKRVVE